MTALTCARPGCTAPTKPHHLACRPCWYELLPETQKKIGQAWFHGNDVDYRAALVVALDEWAALDDIAVAH